MAHWYKSSPICIISDAHCPWAMFAPCESQLRSPSRMLLPQYRGIFLVTASSSLLSLTAFQTCHGPLAYTLPIVSPDLHVDMHSASLFNRKLSHHCKKTSPASTKSLHWGMGSISTYIIKFLSLSLGWTIPAPLNFSWGAGAELRKITGFLKSLQACLLPCKFYVWVISNCLRIYFILVLHYSSICPPNLNIQFCISDFLLPKSQAQMTLCK